MLRNRLMTFLGLVLIASMVLSACGAPTPAATAAPADTAAPAATEAPTVAPTEAATAVPTAVPVTRKGGWLDQIVFSVVSADSAITQLQAGAIDVYAGGLSSAKFPDIKKAGLSYAASNGLYYDVMYNPATFADKNVLNPFADLKIREATNWLYDRNYINQEVYAGGGLAKWFPIQTNGPDYADLADVARGLEAKYAYNLDKAKQVISDEMTKLGATAGADGKWMFNNKPVTLIFLIRSDSDGTRKPLGDYVATQLEKVGFTVDRQYKKSSEASPIWLRSDPAQGKWNMYTAAWSSTVISRDDKGQFQQMYLPGSIQASHPFIDNVNADPAYKTLGDDLANAKFKDLAERRTMMVKAMELSLQDSLQVWLIDGKNYAPYATTVQATGDLAAGIESSQISPLTVRFIGKEGGTLKWGEPDMFADPWNPIAGSNWTFDHAAYGMTSTGFGEIVSDPYTGLAWPLRMQKADVTLQTGLPAQKSLDWVTLSYADKIQVPADAWVDWDAKAQMFLTADQFTQVNAKATDLAGAVDLTKLDAAALTKVATDLADAYATITTIKNDVAGALGTADGKKAVAAKVTEIKGLKTDDLKKAAIATYALNTVAGIDSRDVSTAKRKVVVTYDPNLFKSVKWHDGSPMTVGDFVMGMIMTFDRAKPASPIYDEGNALPVFQSFIQAFKGFKITSKDPLVIEYYSDSYLQDAELNVPTMWPQYQYGEGSWDVLALGNTADAAGELAWSPDKAGADAKKPIDEISLIGGPSLDILSKDLDTLIANKTIPYAPTMGQFVTADEAATRYANLKAWYTAHKHFWIGTGPYFLDTVDVNNKNLTLKNYADYPDLADRWSSFGEPKFADVALDGPGQVKIGDQAVFNVAVTFKGAPYANKDIKQVKYLLYDATGAVISVGDATAGADGAYTVTLGADVTSKLAAGSNKIEVAVIPIPVSVPTFQSMEFVTAP